MASPDRAREMQGKIEHKNVQEFLKNNEKVWMPEVSVNKAGEVIFVDGRHRFAALRDMGVKEIKVMMQGANN